jgi:rSAM/selenodomain-associated transferase 2
MSVSVIVPTLNAAPMLAETLARFATATRSGLVGEVIVVDGGSCDGTQEIAIDSGAALVQSPRGRGTQLAAGAASARGAWFLFCHADTRLEDGWGDVAAAFIARSVRGEAPAAAVFRFALDDPSPAARRLERIVAWRVRVFALPYGDQGLLIAREQYAAVGGFRPVPLMEDVDLVRRIGRGGFEVLGARAETSAARYRRNGYLGRGARNLTCLALYFLGVSPSRLAALYG